jgi:PKD repeat protein
MIRKLAYIFIAIAFPWAAISQDRVQNYRIHVSNLPILIENDLESNWNSIKSDSNVRFDNSVYALLQLNNIPTTEDKKLLSLKGIELLNYVPNFAWITKINKDLDLSVLVESDVRNAIRISKDWKMPEEMRSGIIPSHAGNSDNVEVRVLFWKEDVGIDYAAITKEFTSNIKTVNAEKSWVEIESPLTSLLELSNHPLVQYIEFIEPPIEFEGIKEERERGISTYISENPGKNYYFDGSGVKIAVDEGGIVDTLQDPNFRSRIDRTYEGTGGVSGHKTGVSLRMSGAGNINPLERGTAFGAEIYSGLSNADAVSNGVVIVNRSYGWGCQGASETYGSGSASYDNYVRVNPTFMITHSAGNAGGGMCYANGAGWGNITGITKMAKNIFDVGSSGDNGTLTGFSSRGPARDGRILPHIVAPGPGGTSHASPNLGGIFGQLNQAYSFHNGGVTPHSGLLKAVLLNTADDMLNPGPDFKTGFGHVNARRAYEVVREGQFLTATISQGGSNNHTITVPANVKEVKVLVYWADWEATAGITTRAIVNDIDIVLQDPNALDYQPWVLNPALDTLTLDDFAVRATDTLNNTEQVTIDNPISGTYQLSVAGTMIPQGPQEYFMTYEFVYDEIFVTHPHGGEKFVPNDTERIRWDACDSNLTFDLSYSADNGMTWNVLTAGINADDRYYDWTVPEIISNQVLVKVERGGTIGTSDTTFNILGQPTSLEHVWACADSSLFVWDELNNADGYIVYRIIGDYMDSVAYTTSAPIVLNGLSLTETEYVSIAAVQNGVIGRRIIAIEREPSDLNCNQNDLGALEILNPSAGILPSCMAGANSQVEILIRNWGANAVDSIPVALRVNGGAISYDTVFASIPTGGDYAVTFSTAPYIGLGSNLIEVWTEFAGDGIFTNDTVMNTINVYASTTSGAGITQNFDLFTNCSTSWDCDLVNCAMQDGWYNVTNAIGDDIDWRTDDNGTGTGTTGPSADHTSGSGKYLYLEASGPCVNSTARLHSPCLDMTGINQAEMSFWYHAYGSAIGELHVDAIVDGVLYEDLITPIVGNQGDQWINQIVDLSQFTNHQLVVVIRGSTGGGFYSDLAIDDINISTSPIANFISVETQLCSNDEITLNNFSVYGDTYEWSVQPNTINFEGGTNANSLNPQVSFNASGYYTVQLIATNSIGSDTLTLTDYIYVWGNAPTLSPTTAFCEYDSVIITSNNNGQPAIYYLNGTAVESSSAPSYYYSNATAGDLIYVSYPVNSGCLLLSDTLIVEFVNVENGAFQNGLELNAVANGAQYQWIDCNNNNSAIGGETNQTFIPLLDGAYAVQVTEDGCIDTSDCIVFSTISLNEISADGLSFYPNPTTGELTIDFSETQATIEITVRTVLGQLVSMETFNNLDKADIEIKGETGIYLIEVKSGNHERTLRVVKQD